MPGKPSSLSLFTPLQSYQHRFMYRQHNAAERLPCQKQPCKLFLFNLAKCVTDDDLKGLFSPYRPIYATVALGKRGASRVHGGRMRGCFGKAELRSITNMAGKGRWCSSQNTVNSQRHIQHAPVQRFGFALFYSQEDADRAQAELQVRIFMMGFREICLFGHQTLLLPLEPGSRSARNAT